MALTPAERPFPRIWRRAPFCPGLRGCPDESEKQPNGRAAEGEGGTDVRPIRAARLAVLRRILLLHGPLAAVHAGLARGEGPRRARDRHRACGPAGGAGGGSAAVDAARRPPR